jgi:Tfp pilus assembly pilus retraction ATPase PilT
MKATRITPKFKLLTEDLWSAITDFRLIETKSEDGQYMIDLAESTAFRLCDGEQLNNPVTIKLLRFIDEMRKHEKRTPEEDVRYVLEAADQRYRVNRIPIAYNQNIIKLRHIADNVPHLDELAYRPLVRALMLDRSLQAGGLVGISGNMGQGKTTTASSIVVTRHTLFGGESYTAEKPMEYPLDGYWGGIHKDDDGTEIWGECRQIDLDAKTLKAFGDADETDMECALKAGAQAFDTSAVGGQTFFIGEVATAPTANFALNAAIRGNLVVCTTHTPSLSAIPQRFVDLAGPLIGAESARHAFASALRLMVFQTLVFTFKHKRARGRDPRA